MNKKGPVSGSPLHGLFDLSCPLRPDAPCRPLRGGLRDRLLQPGSGGRGPDTAGPGTGRDPGVAEVRWRAAARIRPGGPCGRGRRPGTCPAAPGKTSRAAWRIANAIFHDGTWPIALIDVEVLPDLEGNRPGRVVVHYLGPHHLDTAGLSAVFRNDHGLDAIFEPVGCDEPEEFAAEDEAAGCGSCGSGGGCGSSSGGCGTTQGDACSGCAVQGARSAGPRSVRLRPDQSATPQPASTRRFPHPEFSKPPEPQTLPRPPGLFANFFHFL